MPRIRSRRLLALKTIWIVSAIAIAPLYTRLATCQTQVSTGPSGFITLRIAGHGGAGGVQISFIGLGLASHTEFEGNLESHIANTLTDTGASWVDDQFNGANGAHFVEITSGPNAGYTADILDTDGAAKMLTVADNFSALLSGGETYRVRKHWTIERVFGQNNEAGLGGGNSITADQILIYNPVSQSYTTFYYQTSGLGGVGWRAAGSPTVNQSKAKLYPDEGLVIKRKQASDLQVRLFGQVKLGPTIVPVHMGANFIGNVYPTDTMTMGNSALYTGNSATGLNGGNVITADQVLIYNGTGYDTYYYQTSGLGGVGWRRAGAPTVNASGVVLPKGKSFIVKRKHPSPFAWVMPQTFSQQ